MDKITLSSETIALIKFSLVYDELNLKGNELLVIKYSCVKAEDKFMLCSAKNCD